MTHNAPSLRTRQRQSHFCSDLLYTNQVYTVKYGLESSTFFNLLRYTPEKMGLLPAARYKKTR